MAPNEVAGCTVATRSYLADARLAARSFLDQHPGARFTIVVVDGDHMPPAAWSRRDVELRTPSELRFPNDELLRMAAIYTPFEIACALKPLALRRALEHADVAIYVDGDMEILHPMDELANAAGSHDVVLVPHVLEPVPQDGHLPDEAGLLGAGMFNGGLVAVGRGADAFLDWWQERLRRHALGRPDLMMLADQRWLDFVPVLFDHHILRDPTYDLAYWNLHERPTAWVDGRLCVVDRPVRCFHYSGLTDERPWILSSFSEERPRVSLAELPAVARQCRGWLDRRRGVDADDDRALGYHWSHTARGVEVDRRARMVTRAALLDAEDDSTGRTPTPPLPFDADGGEAWEAWLRSPATDDGAGRYLTAVRQESIWLQRMFPEVPGPDSLAFERWATTLEAEGAAIPAALLPDPEEIAVMAPDPVAPPVRTPPRPDARAQQPVEAIERAREAVDRGPDGPTGRAGQVLDRVLGGRDRHLRATTEALTDAVAELADRLADLSDRVDRTNDRVHREALRIDEGDQVDRGIRDDSERLSHRLDAAGDDLAEVRTDVDGALEQSRITGAIVTDAEARLLDDLSTLRERLAKLEREIAPVFDDDQEETMTEDSPREHER